MYIAAFCFLAGAALFFTSYLLFSLIFIFLALLVGMRGILIVYDKTEIHNLSKKRPYLKLVFFIIGIALISYSILNIIYLENGIVSLRDLISLFLGGNFLVIWLFLWKGRKIGTKGNDLVKRNKAKLILGSFLALFGIFATGFGIYTIIMGFTNNPEIYRQFTLDAVTNILMGLGVFAFGTWLVIKSRNKAENTNEKA
jgi:hypothetical protein